jgi:hypothetical protein
MLRFRLAYDANLVSAILHIFVNAVFASLRRRAKFTSKGKPKCGAVIFIQRFGDALVLKILMQQQTFQHLEELNTDYS